MLTPELLFDLAAAIPLWGMLLLAFIFLCLLAKTTTSRFGANTAVTPGQNRADLDNRVDTVEQKGFKIWVISWIVTVCVSLLVGEGITHFVETREYTHFLVLATQPNQTIVLAVGRKRIELRTPGERARFVAIISGADEASFGRSHPMGLMNMKLNGREQSYLLGTDAYNPAGFWLLRDFGAGESRLCVLKRFCSNDLIAWIKAASRSNGPLTSTEPISDQGGSRRQAQNGENSDGNSEAFACISLKVRPRDPTALIAWTAASASGPKLLRRLLIAPDNGIGC